MQIEELDKRFNHHPPQDTDTVLAHESVRKWCRTVAYVLNEIVPDGREKALAMTALEECMMWSNAGIARNQ